MEERELFRALARPFESSDLEWRAMFTRAPQEQGRPPLVLVAPYVNRPALINRLNQVCGPGGWQSQTLLSAPALRPSYQAQRGNRKVQVDPAVVGHVSVGLGIRIPQRLNDEGLQLEPERWVWKWDGAGMLTDDPPHFKGSDAGKGDFSNGFKRVCEQFGIGLYLRELKAMKALLDPEGRYKSSIAGFGVQRWNPPPIRGTPSYPGTIPGFSRTEGAPDDGPDRDEGSDAGTEPEAPPQAEGPKELTEQQRKEAIQKSRDRVRAFMTRHGLKTYHLDAVIQTHPQLQLRYSGGEAFGADATVDDWALLEGLTQRNKGRWEEAPKELAEEFPTGPERIQRLDELLDAVKVSGQDLVTINTAKQIGWNDAVEYWIANLESR